MPRFSRMVNSGEKTVYHVMSRTALDGLPFQDAEKDEFVNIIRRFGKMYFTEVMGFCIMGNHIHLLARKEFVTKNYQLFKHLFQTKNEKNTQAD